MVKKKSTDILLYISGLRNILLGMFIHGFYLIYEYVAIREAISSGKGRQNVVSLTVNESWALVMRVFIASRRPR